MTAREGVPTPRPGQALRIWTVALSVYVLAVFHRSSLAVAGLAASERFGISAAALSTFVMVQLVVYAGLQVPVGVLLDRFGSRRLLGIGLVVMTVGQVGFAFADSYALALLARILVGLGDALTFVCVLRLVTTWFAPRRVPFVTQVTGVIGQGGAILAAAPMTWALRELGWTQAYLLAASLGGLLLVLLVLLVRDSPDRWFLTGPPLSWTSVRRNLAEAWRHPGTRLGFWTHFTTQFSATTLTLLWGYPFLVRGEGRSSTEASLFLTLLVVVVMAAGPVLGIVVGRYPWHRSTMVLGIVGSIVLTWTVVLVWPGDAPTWLLVVLMVTTAVGGPASMIGFDLARSFNPLHRLGAATGLVNQGGFIASLVLVVVIGLVLDAVTPGSGSDYGPGAFRWAMSAQYVLWTIGLVQIWRYRRRARAWVVAGRTG